MKNWITCFIITTIFWGVVVAYFLYREYKISGDELRTIVARSSFKSYGSWFLYREDKDWYCVRLSRPVIPERFCVPKKEVSIRNAKDGSSEIGVVFAGQWILAESRYPGAKEEIF